MILKFDCQGAECGSQDERAVQIAGVFYSF